jgi:hypothetical protein
MAAGLEGAGGEGAHRAGQQPGGHPPIELVVGAEGAKPAGQCGRDRRRAAACDEGRAEAKGSVKAQDDAGTRDQADIRAARQHQDQIDDARAQEPCEHGGRNGHVKPARQHLLWQLSRVLPSGQRRERRKRAANL